MVLRAGILQAGLLNQSSAQIIDGSLKFNGSKSTALKRTPGSDGNRKTWTWSAWVKKHKDSRSTLFSAGATSNDTGFAAIEIESDEQLRYSGWNTLWKRSNDKFRDYNQFYHIVVAFDVTQGTASNRVRLYKNGVVITDLANNSSLSNVDYPINDNVIHYIGGIDGGGGENLTFSDYNMTQVYLIDGLQLGPSYFGFTDPLTGTWRPKRLREGDTGLNDGTVWSSNSTNFTNPGQGFNGSDSDYAEVSSSAAKGTFTFPKTIQVRNSVTFRFNSGTSGNLFINDTAIAMQGTGAQTQTVSFSGTLSSISLQSGSQPVLWYFEVDGEILKDSAVYAAFGTNGFYLPMDGNSPIGQDKSGKGNDWTPVNFGGSAGVDQASGALPILEGAGGAVANVGVRTDAYAANLTLALPLVGIASDVSNRINSGSTTKTVSVSGDPASSKLQSNFYGASFYFDGSANSDYVSVADNTEVDVGNGDFTIECWAYVSGYPNNNPGLLSKRGGNGAAHWQLVLNRNGQIQFGDQATWGNNFGTSSGTTGDTIFKNNWHHIAITRTSGSVQAWYDGRKYGTAITNTTDFSTSANFSVGVGRENNYDPFQGYVNDVRVYKGVAKYTDSFVPASTNPDILPDTLSGVSGKSKLTKITEGAVTGFETNSDYLSLAASSDFEFTGDHTIEMFIYHNTLSGDSVPYATGGSGSADQIYISSGGGIYYSYGQTGSITSASGAIVTGKWQHLAISRHGTNLRAFVDGKLVVSSNNSSATIGRSNAPAYIGVRGDGNHPVEGFISNLRIVKGQALYTSNFIPPTEPLTTTSQGATASNVKLLCCQSNAFAGSAAVSPTTTAAVLNLPLSSTPFSDSSATSATITNTGSITTTSAGTNSFNITNAASLNGSSQRITTNNTNISFQNEWTVDIYFKLDSSASGYNALINSGYGSQTSNYMYIAINDDEKPYIETSSSGSATTASNALSKNVWYHGRVTQDGSTITFYINGESVVTKTAQTTDLSSAGTFTIGSLLDNGNNANNFHGLIGPVRVINSNIGTPSPNGEATSSGTLSNSTTTNLNVFGNAAATNFNPFNTDINTVRGQETGYPTLNPLDMRASTALSNGNLTVTGAGSAWYLARSTQFLTTGKYYWEYKWYGNIIDENNGTQAGLKTPASTLSASAEQTGSYAFQYTSIYQTAGSLNTVVVSPGSTTPGDCVMFAYDADAGKMWFGVNGVWNDGANPALGTNSDWTSLPTTGLAPFAGVYGTAIKMDLNFGQKPFKFPPPDGFQPLNAANTRPKTVIARPDQYFGITTWSGAQSGSGGLTRQIDTGHQPDFVWIKQRNQAYSTGHQLYDSVRGAGAEKELNSSGTAIEGAGNIETYGWLNSFDKTGFTVKGGSTDYDYVDKSGVNYVSWFWKAGGSKGTFNVDDVGYANASDVNMNVGGLNNSVYNQTQNWTNNVSSTSNITSGHEARLFNGILSGSNADIQSSQGTTGVINFTSAITGSKIEIYTIGNVGQIGINGSNLSVTANQWVDTGVTSLTSVETRHPGAGSIQNPSGLKVDGKILVDNGVTPPTLPSIAPTGASVGTRQGFSIISYTGDSQGGDGRIPHGLSQEPDFLIYKGRNTGDNWAIYHSSMGQQYFEFTDQGNGGNAQNRWSSLPTDKVIYLGSDTNINNVNHIMYCWHNVPGLQKFGKYTGNNTSAPNGPFVELGFRPALVAIKRVGIGNWIVYDNKRDTFNPLDGRLYWNTNSQNVDNSGYDIDFLSNGFRITGGTNDNYNAASDYVYAAWAEAPAFNLYGGQSNAR